MAQDEVWSPLGGVIFINYVADDRHIRVSRGLAQKKQTVFLFSFKGRRSRIITHVRAPGSPVSCEETGQLKDAPELLKM